jgi:hypothetical protein
MSRYTLNMPESQLFKTPIIEKACTSPAWINVRLDFRKYCEAVHATQWCSQRLLVHMSLNCGMFQQKQDYQQNGKHTKHVTKRTSRY